MRNTKKIRLLQDAFGQRRRFRGRDQKPVAPDKGHRPKPRKPRSSVILSGTKPPQKPPPREQKDQKPLAPPPEQRPKPRPSPKPKSLGVREVLPTP
ncbi:MAG: hypothetical protein AMXMBFR33_35770 [Candidatus Xenobia bacterium]